MKFKNPTLLISFLLIFLEISVFAQESSVKRKEHYNLESGLALQGYDPVAYFTQKKAVEGSKKLSFEYQNVKYRFSNEANLAKFKAAPSKYEPTYGGWCAYAMGIKGEKVEIDPETFKIKDGKLYLFYNKFFTNTLPKWNEDESNLKAKADSFWEKIIN